jgi:hypothetical protein
MQNDNIRVIPNPTFPPPTTGGDLGDILKKPIPVPTPAPAPMPDGGQTPFPVTPDRIRPLKTPEQVAQEFFSNDLYRVLITLFALYIVMRKVRKGWIIGVAILVGMFLATPQAVAAFQKLVLTISGAGPAAVKP